jgi:hypothetical protein
MSEALLRDQVELKRQQSREQDLNRFGSIEREVAVLGVHFKALTERFEEALERAVSGEDLKELKREWETALRDTNHQHSRVFQHGQRAAVHQHPRTGAGHAELTTGRQRLKTRRTLRRQIFFALFTWGLGILGALFVFWLHDAKRT